MQTYIFPHRAELGRAAALAACDGILKAVQEHGRAVVVFAAAPSQDATLEHLLRQHVPWDKVDAFHMDEYIGLDETHPASFRRYLRKHLFDRVKLGSLALIAGEAVPRVEVNRLNEILSSLKIDLIVGGIGENGHIAFNDPPANLDESRSFHIVDLDDRCRQQQVNDGCFERFEDVPSKAISLTVAAFRSAARVVLSVPGARKAEAVASTLRVKNDPNVPASCLADHPDCQLFIDEDSASQLTDAERAGIAAATS